jgi:hypothetical protein
LIRGEGLVSERAAVEGVLANVLVRDVADDLGDFVRIFEAPPKRRLSQSPRPIECALCTRTIRLLCPAVTPITTTTGP